MSRRSRTQAQKVGRWKYLWRRLDRIDRKLGRLDMRQRTIFHGLRNFMSFDKDYLLKVVCRDDLDEAIPKVLREGIALPSSISNTLETRGFRGVSRYKVTRRIQSMNKRLRRELGQNACEKRGKHWTMTRFMREAWGLTVEEAREEAAGS